MSISRIVVTGDFLRVNWASRANQTENIRWLYQLILPSIRLVSDIPISVLHHTGEKNCLGELFYRINGISRSLDGWAKLYNKQPSAKDLGLVWDALSGSLIISFELPEFIKQCLETLEIPYIDLTVHPVRFMSDLLFGLRTNAPEVLDKISSCIVEEQEIKLYAGLASASMEKMNRIRVFEENENIALFAAQTKDDKVLIRDGKFISSNDFLGTFERISSEHDLVLVKPHPYVKYNPIINTLTRIFSNTRIIEDNIYHIFSHASLKKVVSLTSSVSIEAPYFNVCGEHLSPYPYIFTSDKDIGSDKFLQIHPEFYQPDFWAKALEPFLIVNREASAAPLPLERSRIRRTLRSWWGADIFEAVA